MDADGRALRLAERRDGLLTLIDSRAAGLTDEQVWGRVEQERWDRIVRGVYRAAGSPDTWKQRIRAAQLAVDGAGGRASHVSAAALAELLEPSLLPHVTVPPGRSARCPVAKVHRSLVPIVDHATIEGIPTTSVSRTVVDMAALLDRAALEELVDDAICARKATAASILRSLDRAGNHRRGAMLLRSVLDIWTEDIEPGSQAEVRLLRRLVEWGAPRPVTQHEVRLDDGTFVARVDVAWPEHKAALEYEGLRRHAARRVDPDEKRYERLTQLGWRVDTPDKHDLLPGNRRLQDLLRRWLAR